MLVKAVIFPPGCPRLAIKRKPNGSPTPTITVGIVSVARLAAMVASWTDTGVTPYPKGQRTRAAARVLFESEIARWSQVVQDNKSRHLNRLNVAAEEHLPASPTCRLNRCFDCRSGNDDSRPLLA